MQRGLVFVLIFVGILLYLNRAYGFYYDSFKNVHLPLQMKTSQEFQKSTDKQVPIKYVAIGDSFSAGVGANRIDDNFTQIFAEKLSKGNNLVFTNLAVPGSKTADVLKNQVANAISLQPDFITLLVGINDVHDFVSEKDFTKNYSQILSKLKQNTKAKIIVLNIPLLGSSKILLFPYNFLLDIDTKRYNKLISDSASAEGVQIVDLYSKTKEAFKNDSSLYSSDQFHPSSKGYQLWSTLLNEN